MSDTFNIESMYEFNIGFKFIKGKYYKTRGGWKAECIYITSCTINTGGAQNGFFIHKPDTIYESTPIFHNHLGVAISALSIYDAPTYGQHPADIVGDWIEGDSSND